MLLSAVVLVLLLQQTIQGIEANGRNKDFKNNTNQTLFTYICDDEKIQSLEEKLNRIVSENENLRVHMENLNVIINHQFSEIKSVLTASAAGTTSTAGAIGKTSTTGTTSTTSTQTETNESNCGYSYDNLIDVRGDFNEDQQNCQKSTKTPKLSVPTNCAEAIRQSGRQSGVHLIHLPDSKLEPFYVYCLVDLEQPEEPWTIVQRRQDGSLDFYRKWVDYQQGFGNLEGEFFIGLDILHALTQSTLHELWIKLEDFEHATRSANYSSFAVGNAKEAYALKVVGKFTGKVGDSLTPHAGHKFTTQDVDNDIHGGNCAVDYTGGWWYTNCHYSNLNGQYLRGNTTQFAKGVDWYTWHGHNYSLKYVHMAIRPVNKGKKC